MRVCEPSIFSTSSCWSLMLLLALMMVVMADINKTDSMKTKLEGLCRELRRQNQLTLEDEQRKREEIAQQFTKTMRQLEGKLEQQNQSRNDQKREREMYEAHLPASIWCLTIGLQQTP